MRMGVVVITNRCWIVLGRNIKQTPFLAGKPHQSMVSRLFLLIVVSCLAMLVACSETAVSTPPSPTLSPQASQGKSVFSSHCGACHSTSPDTIIVGPSLAGIATAAGSRVTGQDGRTYLYTAILQPGEVLVDGFDDMMPKTYGKDLTGEELDAVIAYMLTLE